VLINNAGHDVGGRRHFVEGEAEQWTAIIETNVNGVIRVTRELLEGMLERDRGHVVNIGSIAGVRPYEGGSAYVASKFAVRGLSECLRLDCRDSRVRITEILPGTVRTEFAERRTGDVDAASRFYGGFADLLHADDVARAIVYALEQPPHAVVSQLVLLPSSQG
jgi:NADP-dependent 3-hydroxy acid dehydrogenase YdfG